MRGLLLLLLAGLACGEEPWVIGSEGASYEASSAEVLTRPIRFVHTEASGVTASFVARSLRGVVADDWRQTQRIAGTRLDQRIDQPEPAYGSEAERLRFGISGRTDDWDDFSVQWDGVIQVPHGGIDLATTSDDGTRVWLDLNRDQQAQASEWGSNGWGSGQAAALRQVHAAVASGPYPIRVQFEDGHGPNSCSLMWRPLGSSAAWIAVPNAAFSRLPMLRIEGPITIRSAITGKGSLVLGNGAVLATAPQQAAITFAGQVRLGADVALAAAEPIMANSAVLTLDRHRLSCAGLRGAGTVQLAGGTLSIASAERIAVRGNGRLETTGTLQLSGLDSTVEVRLGGSASVHAAERTVMQRPLSAPLATVLELGHVPQTDGMLKVLLDGPLTDCGLMAWRADRHGRWFQRLAASRLIDGRQHVLIDLSASAQLQPVGHQAAWNAQTAAESPRYGLLIYADRAVAGEVLADACWRSGTALTGAATLSVLTLPPAQARTGERIALAVRPEPFPRWPLDPDCFSVELEVTAPDGSLSRFAGFADQPFIRHDRGDREVLQADGPPRFGVRFRARQPGLHRLRLAARWADGSSASAELPPLLASGAHWDDIARVDGDDARFLSSQGRFVWPIGQNLNSTYDTRSRDSMGTRLTSDRGSFTREAFLARLIAAGGTGAETWLSPWNLGLEWSDAWPGFRGAGSPNLGNAWALDRYLDLAERHGVHVVLSIFNHGQGRDGGGLEDDWPHHPWRAANGGWLSGPPGLFTDTRALKAQADLFRYLTARWGDSPAVLTWKLWAEVNLVHAPIDAVRSWHRQATAQFARLDPWRHPVTTHWCGDYTVPDPDIAAQPGLAMLTIDAYQDAGSIAELLGQSTRDAQRSGGLHGYGKPVLVTEYGGSPGGTSPERMEAALAVGGWAAFVHGHAGAPMLWWFEWIDQSDRYAGFGALRRFTAGEDLRGRSGRTIALDTGAAGQRLWSRAWQRPGRMLGYLLDAQWPISGKDSGPIPASTIDLGSVAAGSMQLEWWDADLGTVRATTTIDHPGGLLQLSVPPFRRHLAFKLWRREA